MSSWYICVVHSRVGFVTLWCLTVVSFAEPENVASDE